MDGGSIAPELEIVMILAHIRNKGGSAQVAKCEINAAGAPGRD